MIKGVRSFIAAIAVFFAFLIGTATLCSVVVKQVVLDPTRVEQVLYDALGETDLAPRILGRLVPGYSSLNEADRATLGRVTSDEHVREATQQVTFDESTGEINLQPLRAGLVTALRSQDQPALAKRVVRDRRDTVVGLPADVLDRYRDAQDLAAKVTMIGALTILLLAVVAILSSRARLTTCRSLGIAAVLSGAVVGAVYWALPGTARGLSSSDAAQFGALLLEGGRPTVLWIALPVILLGLVLAVAASIMARSSRLRPSISAGP